VALKDLLTGRTQPVAVLLQTTLHRAVVSELKIPPSLLPESFKAIIAS